VIKNKINPNDSFYIPPVTVLDVVKYNESIIHCEIPQGSILGLLLFCIFISDLSLPITNKDTRVTSKIQN